MRVSILPVFKLMKRVNKETLLSSFRFVHRSFVNVSMSPSIYTGFGSPSKDGIRGAPSHLYVWMKWPRPSTGV